MNARKTIETKNKINEIDMYDLPNAKPGKNYSKWFVLQCMLLSFTALNHYFLSLIIHFKESSVWYLGIQINQLIMVKK